MTASIINLKDGTGNSIQVNAEIDANGVFTPHQAIIISGNIVSNTNPLPVLFAGNVSINVGTVSISSGIGNLTFVPAATANGTALGSMPSGSIGAKLFLPANTSLTFTISNTAPTSAPSAVFTLGLQNTATTYTENLSSNQMIYVTAMTGNVLFRWL